MPSDAASRLFKRGLTLELPHALEGRARKLAAQGLIRLEEQSYVRCVNPGDRDQPYVKDRSCTGRAVLRADVDEENHDVRCPECMRVLFPRQKRTFRRLRVWPEPPAMRAHVRSAVEAVGLAVEERPPGLFRVPTSHGEVHVCLVDVCTDPAVHTIGYERRPTLIYVVANEFDHRARLATDIPTFGLVELTTGERGALIREIRRLGRIQDEARPALPSVLTAASVGPVVIRAAEPAATPPSRSAARLDVTPDSWGALTIYPADGQTLRFWVRGRQSVSFSADRLGMTKRNSRTLETSVKWRIMLALCEGKGTCTWRAAGFASFRPFVTQVSELRTILTEVVGLEEDPFVECTARDGLRAKFVALPDAPDETWVGDVWEG